MGIGGTARERQSKALRLRGWALCRRRGGDLTVGRGGLHRR